MKIKKFILKIALVMIFCISTSNIYVFSSSIDNPIFIGEVVEAKANNDENSIRIRVKGYIKGCEIYEEELIAIINKDTKITSCKDKIKIDELNLEKGDKVFLELSPAMTKSIPPQVVAKRIEVSKKPVQNVNLNSLELNF